MRISYSDIKLITLEDLMDILPGYVFICDGDSKEIIIKEKTKDERR